MRKTKIVCTMGPAVDNDQMVRTLMQEGMNVARFNFSHGTHAEQKERYDRVCRIREELGLPIATLLDTKGPEIRIGRFENGKEELKKGQLFTLTTEEVAGTAERVSVSYQDITKDVHEGMTVLLDDGLIGLEVQKVTDTDVICRVQNDGVISNTKGVNIPGAHLSMPFISEQDYQDILFGIENGYDFIAASFTRTADDILQIRKILDEHDCHTINIIAKIENRQGMEHVDEIIEVSDGIMVARGDMGVEIPLEEVPVAQKHIIRKAYNAGKQVITATQMLDSMMKNPRPTRAEATDVANAIYDGTSAIMLSGETAAGLYPAEALKTMVDIAERTEKDIDYRKQFKNREVNEKPDVTNAISHATCTTATDLGASGIITVTKSGFTARMISKYRPACPIIGCTTEPSVCRQLNLSWGVIPVVISEKQNTDDLFDHAVEAALKTGVIREGELVVITAGVPLGVSGTTNLIKVHVAGHVLIRGKSISDQSVTGRLCVCHSKEELEHSFQDGDIIVIQDTSNELLPYIKKASGLIVESEGMDCHAAVVGMALEIPVLLEARHAVEILKSGAVVKIDGQKGYVSSHLSGQEGK